MWRNLAWSGTWIIPGPASLCCRRSLPSSHVVAISVIRWTVTCACVRVTLCRLIVTEKWRSNDAGSSDMPQRGREMLVLCVRRTVVAWYSATMPRSSVSLHLITWALYHLTPPPEEGWVQCDEVFWERCFLASHVFLQCIVVIVLLC